MAKHAGKSGDSDNSPKNGDGAGCEGEARPSRNLDLGIRFVDPALGAALRAAAKADKRSVNSLVNILLEKGLSNLGFWPFEASDE